MTVRMKDIARELGVSIVTVSKALANSPEVGQETARRVLKLAEELDYQPDHAARSLVTGRTSTVGLVVPDLVHPFFAEVIDGASRVFRAHQYGLVISSSERRAELEQREIRSMLARGLDVLMVASIQQRIDSFRYIEKQQKQYILIDRRPEGVAANYVGTDDIAIGRTATKHLIDIGRTRIAYLGGADIATVTDRLKGYQAALRESHLAPAPEYVIGCTHADEYEAMRILLALKPRPDAVFCYSDRAAVTAMEAILDASLRIPEDVAIIGCGNMKYGHMLRVPLSSVDQNSEGTGEQAAKLALTLAKAKDKSSRQSILLPPRLVVRESTVRGASLKATAA